MAVIGGGLGVIENGLVRDRDIKDPLHDVGSFAGADGEGHIEGQDKTENILRVMDSSNVDEWFERTRVNEFCGLE